MNSKTTLTVVTALLVAAAFAGAAANPAVGSQPAPDDAADAPVALQDGDDGGQGSDGQVSGENASIESMNLTNVTLQNVYVNELVANVTHDGTEEEVRMENVTIAAVTVRNATIRNATFDTLGMNEGLATDILGNVGDGINPQGDLPSIQIQARNISDRTITGVELGSLEITNGNVNNVTVEGESGQIEEEVSEPALSGQGVTVSAAEVQDMTIVGVQTNETGDASGGETTGSNES